MTSFKLRDAKIGQRVVIIEPIEDEIRWRHFERIEGVAKFDPNGRGEYVPVRSLRTAQGRPGRKPRVDSGECPTASEMPGSVMVTDAQYVNHDWTEAHGGVMIVDAAGWIGIYFEQRLLHVISSNQRPYTLGECELLIKFATAMEIPVGRATKIWDDGPMFPDNLSELRLRIDDEACTGSSC